MRKWGKYAKIAFNSIQDQQELLCGVLYLLRPSFQFYPRSTRCPHPGRTWSPLSYLSILSKINDALLSAKKTASSMKLSILSKINQGGGGAWINRRRCLSILSKINGGIRHRPVCRGSLAFQFYPRSTCLSYPLIETMFRYFQFYPRSTWRKVFPAGTQGGRFQFYPRSTTKTELKEALMFNFHFQFYPRSTIALTRLSEVRVIIFQFYPRSTGAYSHMPLNGIKNFQFYPRSTNGSQLILTM